MEGTPLQNPREKAGFFSLLTFSWMNDVLKLGSKQPLEEKHLFQVETSHQAERLVADLEREWLAEKRASEQNRIKPRLWKAMMRVISCRDYATVLLIRIFYSLSSNSLPLILWFFLRSISTASRASYSTTLAFVISITLISSVRMLCNIHWIFKVEVIAKVAVIGFVYKKFLTLNRRALENVMPGNIINIVSNDAKTIELLGLPLLAVLVSPLDIAISLAIVWMVGSWQGLIGTSFLVIVFAYGSVAAKKAGQLRRNAAGLIDKRLQLIEEIIKGIRAMKMYAWEWNFRALVARIRRKEISFIRFRGFIISSIYAMFFASSAIAGFISVTALVLTGISLTPVQVFTLLSALANIKLNVTLFIAESLRYIADAKTACSRMQRFLETESIDSVSTSQKQHHKRTKVYFGKRKYKHHSVRIESFRSSKPVLISARKLENTPHHARFQILLECISCSWDQLLERPTLKNVSLKATSGQLVGVTGPVGSGKTSLLMSILEELPVSAGETSCIGKIAYVSQTPWVFSGTMRENILFGKTFVEQKYFEIIKACDLTVDISRFPKGDLTEIGQRGVILSGGQRARVSLARAVYSDADIYLLDDPLSAVDAKVGKHLFDRCVKEFLDRRIRILVTHQLQFLKQTDYVIMLENGLVVYEGAYDGLERQKQFQTGGHLVNGKRCEQVQQNEEDDYGYETITSFNVEKQNERIDLEEEDEDRMVGTVKWWVYWKYLRAALPTVSIAALAVFFVVVQLSWIAPYWWLSRMTAMPFEQQKENINLIVYGSIALVSLLLTIASSFCFYLAALKASENLHDQMITTVMKAPVLFFDTNPVGRILNRFSKDIGCMDDLLPGQLLFAIKLLLYFFGATILSAVANVWLVITCTPLALLFIYLTKYYLKSAREIRRLDSMTCSPVYSCIADTVAGLEVIRSSEMENSFLRRLYSFLDKNTSASIMLKASTRWLAIRGDIISIFLLTSVSAGALFATQSPALAGMSLAFVTESLEVCQYAIRMASEAESHMTSVERVLNYTNIESEPGYSTDTAPDESWPTLGSLTLHDLSLAYFKDAQAVLKSININVTAKEKIGVVGRTGAGKSSLVAALFRMPEPEGQVIIDGVNIKDLNLQASRRSMAVITQDPVLFSGSLRKNLDPFSLYQDHDLWRALEDVQLKTLVQQLPDQLEYKLRESGRNFSVGERQLVCLARALLQRSKIIILDEATANVDFKTDRLIQEVIRNRFKDSTVVTIAHRLNTIMDYDKVLVMEQGRVVEFDKPEVLLQKKNGFFARLVQTQNGHET